MHLPRRTTASFLVAVAVMFAVMWLGQIATAITTGEVSAELAGLGLSTNPVYTLDLAFALPLLALAGVVLMRRSPRATEFALVSVGWVVFMGLGVLAIFAFDWSVGLPVPLEVAGVIGVITAVGTVLTVGGLLSNREQPGGAVSPRLASLATPSNS